MLVSSHVLAELEQVCNWLIVIDHGAVVFQGPASELLDRSATTIVAVPEHYADLPRLGHLLNASGHDSEIVGDGLVITINGAEPRALSAEVNRSAGDAGIVLVELGQTKTTLEDRYLTMVNGGDR